MFYSYQFAIHLLLLIFALVLAMNGAVMLSTRSFRHPLDRKRVYEGTPAVVFGSVLILCSLGCLTGFVILIGMINLP